MTTQQMFLVQLTYKIIDDNVKYVQICTMYYYYTVLLLQIKNNNNIITTNSMSISL